MKYIIMNQYDNTIHRIRNDEELSTVYQSLISAESLGSVRAFNEHCVVIKGGDEVVINLGITVSTLEPTKRDAGFVEPLPGGGGCCS